MEVKMCITKRRSVRKFLNKEISKNIVRDIIRCGHLAPSAKNRKPWHFWVVNKDIKNKIADLMQDKEIRVPTSIQASANVIREAPILILVTTKKENNQVSDILSIGACIQNMCLRATDLEVGSLWIRDVIYVEKEILTLVNAQDSILVSALALGYYDKLPPKRPGKDLTEVLTWLP